MNNYEMTGTEARELAEKISRFLPATAVAAEVRFSLPCSSREYSVRQTGAEQSAAQPYGRSAWVLRDEDGQSDAYEFFVTSDEYEERGEDAEAEAVIRALLAIS